MAGARGGQLTRGGSARSTIDLTVGEGAGVPASVLDAPLFFLVAGLVCAPALAFVPVIDVMGWFLSSLVHEMGHAALSWFFGMPSVPAISLSGHAAALHGDQVLLFALAVWGGIVFAATRVPRRELRVYLVCAAFVLYPLLAFSPAKEGVHLLAGHLAELGFSALCFVRALTGGFTSSRTERWLYASLGWFLFGKNLVLCARLTFSEAARVEYASSGSFGLTNDFLRLSNDLLGCPLELVAGAMLALALAVPPFSWVLARVHLRRFRA